MDQDNIYMKTNVVIRIRIMNEISNGYRRDTHDVSLGLGRRNPVQHLSSKAWPQKKDTSIKKIKTWKSTSEIMIFSQHIIYSSCNLFFRG